MQTRALTLSLWLLDGKSGCGSQGLSFTVVRALCLLFWGCWVISVSHRMLLDDPENSPMEEQGYLGLSAPVCRVSYE